MSAHVRVEPPGAEHEGAFLAMVADFEARDPVNAPYYAAAKEGFALYVEALLAEERGEGLADDLVACTHRWLLEPGGAVVATARLRHSIGTPLLARDGGHVGYDVAPSWRGRGHGHRALAAALFEARTRGLARVLVIADETNAASRRVIEKAGGLLETTVFSDRWQRRICRHWVEVPSDSPA